MNRRNWIRASFWDFLLLGVVHETIKTIGGTSNWKVPIYYLLAWLLIRGAVFAYGKHYFRIILSLDRLSGQLAAFFAGITELARSPATFIILSFVLFLVVALAQHHGLRMLMAFAQFMLLVSAFQARKWLPLVEDYFDYGLVSWEHSPEVASLDFRFGHPPPSLKLCASEPSKPIWLRSPRKLGDLLLECHVLLDADSKLGVLFRARRDGSSWVQVDLRADYGGVDTSIVDKTDGTSTQRGAADIDIGSHRWHTLRCEIKNRRIWVEVDGASACRYESLHETFREGRFGFIAIKGCTHIDNVVLATT